MATLREVASIIPLSWHIGSIHLDEPGGSYETAKAIAESCHEDKGFDSVYGLVETRYGFIEFNRDNGWLVEIHILKSAPVAGIVELLNKYREARKKNKAA